MEIKGLYKPNKKALIGIGLVILTALAIYLFELYSVIYPSTENAYVDANLIHVAPKINGYVRRVYVKNNQFVKKGDILVRINTLPFILEFKKQQQILRAANQEATYAQQHIASAMASQERALSSYHFSQQMAVRYTNLFKAKADSLQNMQKYITKTNQAKQALEQAKTALQQAKMQYEVAKTKISVAKINVSNAQLNRSYTGLNASVNGYISHLNLQTGQLVMSGQKLFGLVDDGSWWIDANFKETQLSRIKPGQRATVKLDMYSHRYIGVVQSISYASGSTFSLLPPENATGNWVKVIQYFPVRVVLKNDPNYPLRVGASARVTIDTLNG